MRKFALSLGLLCIVTLPAQAAISVTARGTGNDATSGTTIAVATSGTIAVGSWGVLVLAIDNAGSGGATAASPSTFTDAKSNLWTRRLNPIYDPAGASAGVEMAFYTAPITTALLSSDSSTITFAGGVSVASSAWAFWEVVPTAAFTPSFVTGACATTCGSATATPTVTTSSITSGDVVIGGGGAESADTWAGDADTTNGSWATHQHTAAGTGATGMSVTTQSKVVTATATQTYNPTLTSADTFVAWIQITEIPAGGMGKRIIWM